MKLHCFCFKHATISNAGDIWAKNLRNFSSKFQYSSVHEQFSSNVTSTHNHRNLLENLRKFIVRVSLVLRNDY